MGEKGSSADLGWAHSQLWSLGWDNSALVHMASQPPAGWLGNSKQVSQLLCLAALRELLVPQATHHESDDEGRQKRQRGPLIQSGVDVQRKE